MELNDLKKLISSLNELKGARFIGVKNYIAKSSGEVADHVVNINVDYVKSKARDLEKLKSLTVNDVMLIIKETGYSFETVNTAMYELLNSLEKAVNGEVKSNQSKAQSDAYTKIANGVKVHNKTGQIYIYAMGVSKKVIVKGEYKKVNSSEKTLAKRAIERHCDFKSTKYRNYIVDLADMYAVNGEVIG